MPKTKKTNITFDSMLDTNKVQKTTAKKSTVPTIQKEQIPSEVSKAAKDFIKLSKDKKRIEAELNDASSTIIGFVSTYQDKQAFTGNFNKSYNVEDVQYTTKNSFTIDAETASQIKTLLGKAFNDLIKEKKTVTLKEEVFENEELQKKLAEKMGNCFAEFFVTESAYKVVEGYDEKIYGVAQVQEKLDEIRTFVKPYKPSLK